MSYVMLKINSVLPLSQIMWSLTTEIAQFREEKGIPATEEDKRERNCPYMQQFVEILKYRTYLNN
jgi:hypothetical protein